jgi:hypothetical protein
MKNIFIIGSTRQNFMVRFCTAALCAVMCAGFAGCSDISQVSTSMAESSSQSESQEETSDTSETEPTEQSESILSVDELSKLGIDTENTSLYDLCDSLSQEENSTLNNYVRYIADTFSLNAGVIITDDIGDKKPDEYAGEYYKELYGTEPGFLFLVNNDTGDDVIYTKGYTSFFITDDVIVSLFAEISPMLVTGDTYEGVNTALEAIAAKLPRHIADRTGTLDMDEITEIDGIIAKSTQEDEKTALIFVSDIDKEELSDYIDDECSKTEFSEDAAILVINIETGDSLLRGTGKFEKLTDSNDSTQAIFSSYLKKTDETDESDESDESDETDDEASYDIKGAAEAFGSLIINF